MLIALSVGKKSFVPFLWSLVGHWQALTFIDWQYPSFKLCCHCHVIYDSSHSLPLCAPVSNFPLFISKQYQGMVVHTCNLHTQEAKQEGFLWRWGQTGIYSEGLSKGNSAKTEREEEKKRRKKVSHCNEDCHTDFTFLVSLPITCMYLQVFTYNGD